MAGTLQTIAILTINIIRLGAAGVQTTVGDQQIKRQEGVCLGGGVTGKRKGQPYCWQCMPKF
jgi:hypothetical protein